MANVNKQITITPTVENQTAQLQLGKLNNEIAKLAKEYKKLFKSEEDQVTVVQKMVEQQKKINEATKKQQELEYAINKELKKQAEYKEKIKQNNLKQAASQGFFGKGLDKKRISDAINSLEFGPDEKDNKRVSSILKTSAVIKTFGNVLSPVTKHLKKFGNEVLETTKQFIDLKTGVATYATGTSLISNADARNTILKYGLTGSQAFAFNTAKGLLNIQSEEDLMYMNDAQRSKFMQYMDKYSKWYDQMESSGTLNSIQEAQLTLQELKQQLAMDLLSWVANNKEVIVGSIKIIANTTLKIATWLGNVISTLSGASLSRNADYYNSQSSKITNINITSNANVYNPEGETTDASIANSLGKLIGEALG